MDATNPIEEVEEDEDFEMALDNDQDDESGEAEAGEAAVEDEDIEIEYEGQKYKINPALKDSILRQADYTRKTQEVAELRKNLETTLTQANEVSQKERALEAQLSFNDQALTEYQKIDWQRWMQLDPAAASKARMEYDDLYRGQDTLKAQLSEAQSQRTELQQRETATRLAEAQKVLVERIPGWGQEKANAILSFGQEAYGLSAEELKGIDDPRAIMILHDAMEHRKAAKTAATVKKVEQQQAIKPAATVKGGGKVNRGPSEDDSPEEWAKKRNAQLAKQGRR